LLINISRWLITTWVETGWLISDWLKSGLRIPWWRLKSGLLISDRLLVPYWPISGWLITGRRQEGPTGLIAYGLLKVTNGLIFSPWLIRTRIKAKGLISIAGTSFDYFDLLFAAAFLLFCAVRLRVV